MLPILPMMPMVERHVRYQLLICALLAYDSQDVDFVQTLKITRVAQEEEDSTKEFQLGVCSLLLLMLFCPDCIVSL